MKSVKTKPAPKKKAVKASNNRPAQKAVKKQVLVKSAKTKTSTAKSLQDLFIDELKDIYWAEKALTKAIPKMIKNATAPDLKEALTKHLEETKEHVIRLEKVFSVAGKKVEAKKCEAMAGLIKEADEIIQETKSGNVRDAGIISAAQKIEHYEIATYGTLCAFAKIMGQKEALSLLGETLDEEKDADEKLTDIAEDSINPQAVRKEETSQKEEDMEEEEEEEILKAR